MGEKAPVESNNIISSLNFDTALKVQRIIDESLINTLDFRNKLEIAVSVSESETESKQKIRRN